MSLIVTGKVLNEKRIARSWAWYRGRSERRHTSTPGEARFDSCRELHGSVAEVGIPGHRERGFQPKVNIHSKAS